MMGSLILSTMVLSTSVSSPTRVSLTCFPSFLHMSRTIRCIFGTSRRLGPCAGHGNILKLIRKFAELTGGFGEGIQLEPFRSGEEVTMDSVMTISPTTAAQLIQLAQIDADETFAVVSAGIGRGLRRGEGAAG